MTATQTRPGPIAQARATGLRFYQVQDDKMDPTIRKRDFVLLAPVDRWSGEGYYLISNGLGETIYCCNGFGGTRETPAINLHPHNKVYCSDSMSKANFDEKVLGKVAMICHVVDHGLLPNLGGAYA